MLPGVGFAFAASHLLYVKRHLAIGPAIRTCDKELLCSVRYRTDSPIDGNGVRPKFSSVMVVRIWAPAVRDAPGAIRLDAESFERSDFLRKAGEALVQGDDHFRQVLDLLPAAVYVTNASGRITYYNEAAAALWGYRPQLGLSEWCGFWKLYWPDGRPLPHDECPMAIAVRESRPIRGMEALAERPDGIRVPVIPYPTPLYDAAGELIGAVNMVVDITDRKRAQERQKLLINEIQHRIKNTLAVVQAIAAQTLHNAPVERDAFVARLHALAGAHDLLRDDNWHQAALIDLVGKALNAFRDTHRERFVIDGPDGIFLDAQKSSLLVMALHELATNAVKYGALSNETGRVCVAWDTSGDEAPKRFRLCWRESGGPPVSPPKQKGFGSLLIERALQSQLGPARLDFDPGGLVCSIEISL
jgi:PAS domain S-box-containing protein